MFTFLEDTTLHGFYGVSDQEAANHSQLWPAFLYVYEPNTSILKKTIEMSRSPYEFTASDLSELSSDRVYDLVIVSALGVTMNSTTGYLVSKKGGTNPPQPSKVTKVTLDKTSLTMNVGESGKLTAKTEPADATVGKTLRWESANEAVVTVTADGSLTAVAVGTAVITVTSIVDGAATNVKATCSVTVVDYEIRTGDDDQPLIAPMVMNAGETRQLLVWDRTAGTKQTATWKSADPSVAVVDAGGIVTAVGVGSAQITATAGGLELSCRVNVGAGICFQKQDGKLIAGDTDVLHIIYTPANAGDSADVTWSSSDETVLTVTGNGIADGIVTAGNVTEEKAAVVTATVKIGELTLMAACNYTVYPNMRPESVKGKSIYAIPAIDATLKDLEDQLKAIDASWEWADPEDTPLAVFSGMMEKEFAVSYTDQLGNVTTDQVTVKYLMAEDLKIEGLPAKGAIGKTYRVTASYRAASQNAEILGKRGASVEWKFERVADSKDKGAIENEDNLAVTADGTKGTVDLVGKTAGSVTIKAVLQVVDKNNKVYEIGHAVGKFTVTDGSVAELAFKVKQSEDGGALQEIAAVDDTYRLTKTDAAAVYLENNTPVMADGKEAKITYRSSDASIVKIGKADKNAPKLIPLILGNAGVAYVTATAADKAGSSRTIRLEVKDYAKESIALSSADVTFNTLKNTPVELEVYNGFGGVLDSVTESSNPAICTVVKVDGSNKIRLVQGADKKKGTVSFSVTVKEGEKTVSQTVSVNVKVLTKAPAVTVKQLKKVNTFYKNDADCEGILSVGAAGEKITRVDIKEAKTAGSEFAYAYDDSTGRIAVAGTAEKLSVTACTLRVYLDGYTDPVEKSFKIQTETTAVALSSGSGSIPSGGAGAKTMRTQLLDKKTKAPISLANATVTAAGTPAEGVTYTCSVSGNDLIISADKAPKKKETITLTFKSSDWNETREMKFTVNPADPKKASLKLGAKTLTLYNYGLKNPALTTGKMTAAAGTSLNLNGWYDDTLLEKVRVEGANADAGSILGTKLYITYDKSSGMLVAGINGEGPKAGTYKYKLMLDADSSLQTNAMKADLTVKVVDAGPAAPKTMAAVKVSAKGSIDVLNRRETMVTVTPKFTGVAADANVLDVRLDGRHAHLFQPVYRSNGVLALRLKDDVNVITKYKYELQVVYLVQTQGVTLKLTSSPFNIQLKQGKAKTSVYGSAVYSSTSVDESKPLNFVVTNSAGRELEIDEIRLDNFTNDFAYVYDSADGTGRLIHHLNGETVRGKTYTLKFLLYLKDRGDNEKPVTVTCKVRIVK